LNVKSKKIGLSTSFCVKNNVGGVEGWAGRRGGGGGGREEVSGDSAGTDFGRL